ncbi:MAG: hypothetical protein N2491_03990 [Negativicutes bacterium]|nr:hypothetical protein [Negativicutes bacterium]
MEQYREEQLRGIARECQEFEHVINAMGYGYSLLNVSPENYVRRCNDCIHWAGGSCKIFLDEISQWR